MAAFYFFTEPERMLQQTSIESYGSKPPTGGKDVFMVSGLHKSPSSGGALKAFAVCNGNISVQEVNATTVNLILKPSQQAENDLPFISYIIYKGISKDSLWDSAGNIKTSGNDLVTHLHNSKNANGGTLPTKDALGVHLTATKSATLYGDDRPIDNLFYRSQADFTSPLVHGGMHLGDFVINGLYGLTIITERIGYLPAIKLARQAENRIEVTSFIGSTTPPNNTAHFEHWHKKEEILNFLDPCSFFGSFGEKQLKAWDGAAQKHKALSYDEVYTKVLKGTSGGNFLNRNAICLDIRSEHGGSLNYYKNYGDAFQFSTDDWASSTLQNYYTSGWPWLLVTAPSGLASGQKSVILDIALPKTDNTLPLVYLSQLPGTAPISDPERFVEVRRQSFSDYLTPFSVVMSLMDEGGTLKYRSSIARLMYLRRVDKNDYINPPVPAATTLPYKEHLDHVFQPYRMGIPFDRNGKLAIKVYGQEVFVDKTHVDGTRFIGYAGLCEDQDNYTFFVYPIRGSSRNEVQSQKGYAKNTNFDHSGSMESFLSYLVEQYGYFFIRHEHTVDGQATTTYSTLNSGGWREKPSVLIIKKSTLNTAETPAKAVLKDLYPIFLTMTKDTNAVIVPADNLGAFEQHLAGLKGGSTMEKNYFLIIDKNFGYDNI
jgi:hypothetical protein